MNNLKSEYSNQIKDRKTEAHNWDKMANSIKQTPLNKKTYLDVVRKRNKIRNGAQVVGTLLGVAGSTALGVATKSPSVALGTMVTTGLFGGYATSKIGTTETKQYNKKHKKDKLKEVSSRQFYLN